MDAKTKRIRIGVCAAGFLLTSTFSWGIISGTIDIAQNIIEETGFWAKGSIVWILAHANAMVPLIFIGVIIWLARQKPKE
ncbi:MAG: hypothetical protein IH898_09110 [Planctomycetes bacterium]|nr:hypothetical protein [Planctomycetota bacterium]